MTYYYLTSGGILGSTTDPALIPSGASVLRVVAEAGASLDQDLFVPVDSNDRVRLLLTEASGDLVNSGGAGGVWTPGSGLVYDQKVFLSGGVRCGSGINGFSGSNAVEPTSLTLWAWVRNQSFASGENAFIAKPHSNSASPSWAEPYWSVRLGINATGNLIGTVIRTGAVAWASRQEITASRALSSQASTWWNDHLVGLTYTTGTGVLKLWIDGEEIATSTVAGSIAYGTAAVTPWVSGYVWSGGGDRPNAIIHALGICDTPRPASWWHEMYRRARGTWR